MNHFDDDTFTQRRKAAAAAKQAQLDKFQAGVNNQDPAVARRRAERAAVHDARQVRQAARAAAVLAAQEAQSASDAAFAAKQAEAKSAKTAKDAADDAARPSLMIREAASWAAQRASKAKR